MKKTIIKILLPLFAGSATSAFATTQVSTQTGIGTLTWFFIGFGVMVLVFQAAPAIVVFLSILKGLFSSSPTEASFSPWKGKLNK